MPNQKFTNKVNSQEHSFKLKPKVHISDETYLQENAIVFKEFLQYYEQTFSKADALRMLNKVERDIGEITAITDLENNKGKVSHVKADFMYAYIREHLPFGFVEKTFKHSVKTKLLESDLVEALQSKFHLGDHLSNCGIGVIYSGNNASKLPEHVDIRDALDDHILIPAVDAGKKILESFIQSKQKTV